jgi:uncharacterized membrane protein YfcA
MGLPLIATPILAAILGARAAVVVMSLPVLVTNVLLVYEGRRALTRLHEIWPLVLAGGAGVIVGVFLLARLDQSVLGLVIATAVVLFLARGERLLDRVPSAIAVRAIGPLLGTISGILQGTTSIGSPLIAGYMHARRLAPSDFVVSLAVTFSVWAAVHVAALARVGLYDRELLSLSLLALAPTLLALWLGVRLREHLGTLAFRRFVTALLVLSAAVLTIQGLRGLGLLP